MGVDFAAQLSGDLEHRHEGVLICRQIRQLRCDHHIGPLVGDCLGIMAKLHPLVRLHPHGGGLLGMRMPAGAFFDLGQRCLYLFAQRGLGLQRLGQLHARLNPGRGNVRLHLVDLFVQLGQTLLKVPFVVGAVSTALGLDLRPIQGLQRKADQIHLHGQSHGLLEQGLQRPTVP